MLVLWVFHYHNNGPVFGKSHEAPVETAAVADDMEHDGDDCGLFRRQEVRHLASYHRVEVAVWLPPFQHRVYIMSAVA
jgi:hypothetical protein